MAGTIITTPALGASDWSDWITQQERTDRGFMRVSLTNFSATTASTIATGSVLECAGSIYQFTDTAITLASGTASANVAVYYYVIPSAGGTTCTIQMNSVAPVWVDAKQGFYASAASVTRVIGGCYIGTALVYYNKFLFIPKYIEDCLERNSTRPILKKIFELGEWNMDTSDSVTISFFSSNWEKTKMTVFVRNDTGNSYYDIAGGGYSLFGDGTLIAYRETGGIFDSEYYNATASTVANRGYIFAEIEA